MPLVSIIVSCYNQGLYLKEAINSILEQTYKEWECIIIDDGSTDQTRKVAESFVSIDSKIKYIYQENQGVCAARNNAIKASVGKYILCLDADDKISDDYLSLSVNELEKDSNVTLVATDYCRFGRSHKIVKLEPYSIEKLMGHNLFVNCSMFRRKDFDRVGGFNLNMKSGLEDWDFWLSLLEHGGNVKYLEGIHFYYRIGKKKKSRNQSISTRNHDVLRKQIWLNHIELYSSKFLSPRDTDEYLQVAYSLEYRLGKLILKPIRFLFSLL